MTTTHPSIPLTPNPTKASSSPPKHPPQISLHPLTKSDLPRLSLLEHLAFENDEFSDLAFGRERGSEEGLRLRSEQLGKFWGRGDCWFVKAVLGGREGGKGEGEEGEEDGDEEKGDIVGVAGWMSGGGEEGEGKRNEGSGDGDGDGKQEEKEEGKGEGEEINEVSEIPKVKTKEELEKIWGKGSNFKLCEDVFVRGDEYMFKACGKERWLRASPWGIGLYRKHGFQEVHAMDIRLDLYEGGEGMGRTSHVIMRRGPGGFCEGKGSRRVGEKEGEMID
ncbi:predicted protein [Sclerotinia sclerotiorum 1980 UF-70]|uniref:Uncharacterized protein n=1 Tax=Sclerotinia sclerotiorum (strain ATCC 18683 / 1980 / Ss-1) TaxID=665079 RepID=A7EI26_SCLS1|nr:predicted protein [Sclerotinia sclerotiorum 1980 UF-70]EDO02492.1 predicted protein [Sclerotinia sclerotiorum 1980 UF-70]